MSNEIIFNWHLACNLDVYWKKRTSAVSETLNVSDVSLNRKFSVGTNPSKNIFIPKMKYKKKVV